MSVYLNDISPGDELHVAWVENGSCEYDRFEVCEPQHYTQWAEIIARSVTTDACLLETPSLPVYLPEPQEKANYNELAYRVLGVAQSRDALYWRILRLLLAIDYAPLEILNLIMLQYMDIPLEPYAEFRNKSPSDLQAEVDSLIAELSTEFRGSMFVKGGLANLIFQA